MPLPCPCHAPAVPLPCLYCVPAVPLPRPLPRPCRASAMPTGGATRTDPPRDPSLHARCVSALPDAPRRILRPPTPLGTPIHSPSRNNEPNTLTYELSFSDTDVNTLIIFERYRSPEDLHEIHEKSDAYKLFRKARRGNLPDRPQRPLRCSRPPGESERLSRLVSSRANVLCWFSRA